MDLNFNKILEKINLDNLDKKKISIILLACLILIYLDYAFIIKLQLRSLNKINPQISKLKTDIKTLSKDLAAMEKSKRNKDQIRAAKAKKIISEGEIPFLLENISTLANKNNVRILQIMPSKETKKETALQAQDISSLLITVDLVCSYHHLGKFINELERADEIIAVENLKIENDSSDYLHQKVDLAIKAYVRK